HLSAESANELKRQFNLTVDEQAEAMVEADVITWVAPAGHIEEAIGIQAGGNNDVVELRSRGTTLRLIRKTINTWTKRKVPALTVLTKEEFYRGKLAEIAPGEDADKHIQLADVMAGVGDYDHALEHLNEATRLGNSKQPQTLRAKLAKVELYRQAAGERALLDQLKAARHRKEFTRGCELIAEYEKKYPQGKLASDMAAEKQRFEAARTHAYTDKVAQAWLQQMNLVVKARIAQSGTTLQAARDWIENGAMGKEVRNKIAERLQIPLTEVEELWQRRVTSGIVTNSQQFSYGIGSWVLGEQKILAKTQQGKAETGQGAGREKTAQQERDERLQRKIQEHLRNQAQARRNVGGEEEDNEEAWWKAASPEEKVNFLKAYYAEFSGDMELVSAHVQPCVTCGGVGTIPLLGSAGGEQKNLKCWTCKKTRFRRWIRAR
ncbi:MAG TPA: hypothetical protein VK081_04010, partial [Planctomycetota bacterium]|nr:hypothetical protein [Planctomycetota bacterium]